MTLANPSALFGALLAIPIVVCYVLKVRMRRVPVSTVMFWEQVFEEKNPRSLWRQLRHVVSLLLQLLILTLLIAALADPVSEADVQQRRRTVLVIDVSASMQVVQNGQTRLDAAKRMAEDRILAMKPQDELAIISASGHAQVVNGLTSHQRTLRRAISIVTATDGTTNIMDAVELAEHILADHPRSEITVLTDGGFAESEVLMHNERCKIVAIGTPVDNIAVTQFQVRRSLKGTLGYQILVEVKNFSERTADCSLEFGLNSELLDVIPLQLKPMETWSEVLDKTATHGGVISVGITGTMREHNALSVDDRAVAVLPTPIRIPVTLVTDGNWFLQRVLQANDIVDLTVLSEIPPNIADNGVLILHQKVPPRLPDGKILVVQPAESTDLWTIDGIIEQPFAGAQDHDSDLLRHVRLENVLMPQAVRILPTADHTRLVDSIAGEPLYVRFLREQGDVVVLAVDLDQSDLPLRTAFPIMLSNLLSFYSNGVAEIPRALSTGESLSSPLAVDLREAAIRADNKLMLESPDKTIRFISAGDGEVLLGPWETAGIWDVSAVAPSVDDMETRSESGPRMQVACNLSDENESNLRQVYDFTGSTRTLTTTHGGRPIWFYLIAAVFALVLTEWGLYHRRFVA